MKSLSVSVPAVGASLAASCAGSMADDGKGYKQDDAQDRLAAGTINCDLMVYGATSAGVIAAYTAKMYGLKVFLVEPGRHLGGLSSGGLGKTDTGNESAITGLSQEFYIRVGQYYGKTEPSYRFEPHVAERIFARYIDEAGVEVLFSRRAKNVQVNGSRRMLGDFVMTEHHCIGTQPVTDGIAMGAYGLDSHCCQRVVVDHHVENEGLMNVSGFPPYPISYRSMIPKGEEITNLIVPVCVSASHASYGSIRMEPVFMALGQAAGIAAFHATAKNKSVQNIEGRKIQEELRKKPLTNRKVPAEYSKILPFRG